MQISDQYIKVQKACVGLQQASGLEMGVSAMSMLAGTSSADAEQGRVLMLLNMVTAEELMDRDEYDGEYNPFLGKQSPRLTKQKSARMSRRNVRSTAKSSSSRSRGHSMARRRRVLARFTSNTTPPSRHRRHFVLWLAGSLRTAPSWSLSLARFVLTFRLHDLKFTNMIAGVL